MDNKTTNEKNRILIDFCIASISKETIRDDIINWFQQSPLHWLFILTVMKYYYESNDLSKQDLLEAINQHLATEGKKTVTTEFKYIDDAVQKGFVNSETSKTDSRKKLIIPTQQTVSSIENWFMNFHSKFNGL
mgnify:CR=1 FL=1